MTKEAEIAGVASKLSETEREALLELKMGPGAMGLLYCRNLLDIRESGGFVLTDRGKAVRAHLERTQAKESE